ncbi:MAG TPA: RseA family anti-sigma factor, partial [Burkholderiaceae bacterium]|nr:RseA family anti-sigma factor [Burkholderiaceae bacterium]
MNDSTDSGRARALQDLCALVDGECDASALGGACAQWRTDASLRASWHAYHLIGDVMRSDELASDAGRDAAFVRSLRERLAQEPVILAPSPAGDPAPERGSQVRPRAS